MPKTIEVTTDIEQRYAQAQQLARESADANAKVEAAKQRLKMLKEEAAEAAAKVTACLLDQDRPMFNSDEDEE